MSSFSLSRVSCLFWLQSVLFLRSLLSYVFLVIFLLCLGFFFFHSFFLYGEVSLFWFFYYLPWLMLVFLPVFVSRIWADDFSTGTVELLFTLPFTSLELVAAKFLSLFFVFFVALLFSSNIVVIVSLLGDIDWGSVVVSYLGVLFMGVSILSVGMFFSGLVRHSVSVYLLTSFFCFLFFFLGTDIVLQLFPYEIRNVIALFSFGAHYESMLRGVLDSRDILYFISFIFSFLTFHYLSVRFRFLCNTL